MALFQTKTEVPETDGQPDNESQKKQILDIFSLNEAFLSQVATEINEQQEKLEVARKNGAKAFRQITLEPLTEIALGSIKISLPQPATTADALVTSFGQAWNNPTVSFDRNTQTFQEAKGYLEEFALAAAADEDYKTAVSALGLTTDSNSIPQRETMIRLKNLTTISLNPRHSQYYLITEINRYIDNPNKLKLKAPEDLTIRPAAAPLPLETHTPLPTATTYQPLSPIETASPPLSTETPTPIAPQIPSPDLSAIR